MRYVGAINATIAAALGVALGGPTWFVSAFIWSGWVWAGPAWNRIRRWL